MTRISMLELLKKIGLSFRRNWGLKLVSLFFAVILWNYVIVEVDPMRQKTFPDIPTQIRGINQLKAANYTIEGAEADYLKDITVNVDLHRSEFPLLQENDIKAWVNVANITGEGTYILNVEFDALKKGTVRNFTPETLSVTVKKLAKKIVPVTCDITGKLPEGYWRGDPVLTPGALTITGAETRVNLVDKARITVSLDDLKTNLASARSFVLLDAEGNVLSSAGLEFSVPNCTVNMEVLPKKTVNVIANQVGTVARGYEVTGVSIFPTTVVIYGTQERLDAVTELVTGQISIDGASQTVTDSIALELPEGVRVEGGSMVNTQIAIAQKIIEKTLDSLPISVKGLGAGLKLEQSFTSNVTVTCPELLAAGIRPSNISLWVDATDLGAGNHTLTVMYDIDENSGIISVVPSRIEIVVIITQK